MRKLKTWEIVLLVIFYPVGICVLIYRLVKKSKLKREAEEAARLKAEERERKAAADRERREREAAYRDSMERKIYRVVGVTFQNENGRSRQTVLRQLKRDEPSPSALSLGVYDYKGSPAVGVFYSGEQVGSIGKDDLPGVLEAFPRYEKVESYDVTGGFQLEDGDRANLGLDIAVYFKKAACVAVR